jgi:hypothetical protein
MASSATRRLIRRELASVARRGVRSISAVAGIGKALRAVARHRASYAVRRPQPRGNVGPGPTQGHRSNGEATGDPARQLKHDHARAIQRLPLKGCQATLTSRLLREDRIG